MLAQAAAHIAGPTHRNMGTVGGNLCLDTRCIFYNQSEWWRDANNHCLKTTGTICHVAPKSRGVCFATFSGDLAPALLTLGAEVDIAGPQGKRTIPLDKLYIGFARQDVPVTETQGDGKYLSFAAAGRDRHRGAREEYARPALGLRQDPHPHARSNIRSPASRSRSSATGDTLADLRVAFTGTNPRPVLLDGTAELCGGPLDERVIKGLDALVRDQIMPMKTTFTPGHYRRRVAGVLARRLLTRLFEELTARGPACSTISPSAGPTTPSPISSTPTWRAGSARKIAFIDPDRSLSYGELQARSYPLRQRACARSASRQEDRVALLLHDTVDYPVAFWGTIRAGSVAIPLNTFLNVAAIRLYPRRLAAPPRWSPRRRWRRRSGR